MDVGANIGLASIFYANKHPQARILAIEPEPSNFEMLRKNVQQYPNITPLPLALWKEDAALKIANSEGDYWGFRIEEVGHSIDSFRQDLIHGTSLDRLMKAHGLDYIDLLKVDIEGAEKEVFESSAAWIDRVGAIAVECHDRFRPGCTESVRKATSAFDPVRHGGDIVFLIRKGLQDDGRVDEGSDFDPFLSRPPKARFTLPLKIEWAA